MCSKHEIFDTLHCGALVTKFSNFNIILNSYRIFYFFLQSSHSLSVSILNINSSSFRMPNCSSITWCHLLCIASLMMKSYKLSQLRTWCVFRSHHHSRDLTTVVTSPQSWSQHSRGLTTTVTHLIMIPLHFVTSPQSWPHGSRAWHRIMIPLQFVTSWKKIYWYPRAYEW